MLSAPPIEPLASAVARPTWSVMIPTYNCAQYLGEAIKSVLAADVPTEHMQIEVVDDYSTKDDPEAVVREVGGGRVAFHRQAENVGLSNNFNTCIRRSRGHLVHILHGDDRVAAGFYERVGAAFTCWTDAAAVFTRTFIIDEVGALEGLSDRIPEAEARPTRDARWMYYRNPLYTPSVVVRRDFYERHGGFRPELSHVADWDVWARAITSGGGVALNEPLADYRMFGANHTSQLLRSGGNFQDQQRLGEIFGQSGYPGFDARRFRGEMARYALRQSRRFQLEGDAEAARQNRGIWRQLATPAERVKQGVALYVRRMLP